MVQHIYCYNIRIYIYKYKLTHIYIYTIDRDILNVILISFNNSNSKIDPILSCRNYNTV